MFKIINPEKVRLVFEGNGGSVLFSGKKFLPVKINILSCDGKFDYLMLDSIDGFNILDIQIISETVKDLIITQKDIGDIDFILVKLINDGKILNRNYFALKINNYVEAGCIKATETDWLPDAQYPVKYIDFDFTVLMDKELKFPILCQSIVDLMKNNGAKMSYYQYPKCK